MFAEDESVDAALDRRTARNARTTPMTAVRHADDASAIETANVVSKYAAVTQTKASCKATWNIITRSSRELRPKPWKRTWTLYSQHPAAQLKPIYGATAAAGSHVSPKISRPTDTGMTISTAVTKSVEPEVIAAAFISDDHCWCGVCAARRARGRTTRGTGRHDGRDRAEKGSRAAYPPATVAPASAVTARVNSIVEVGISACTAPNLSLAWRWVDHHDHSPR